MPELPDLQVFSKNLSGRLKGKKLEKLEVVEGKKISSDEKELNDALAGKKLTDVYRLGKELYFEFDKDTVLSMHLMLNGKLILEEGKELPKFTIAAFLFEKDEKLSMTDFQKMAKITLNPENPKAIDALSEELTADWLQEKLKKSKAAIKSFLIDQKIIGGIGNAYADEILWEAKVSPKSIGSKIPEKQIKQLAKAIAHVLKDAEAKILKSHPDIIAGEIRDFMAVHSSKRKTSPTGGEILQESVGGKKTYYTDEQELFS